MKMKRRCVSGQESGPRSRYLFLSCFILQFSFCILHFFLYQIEVAVLPILIDGYNVLYQSGLLGKGRGPGFLERARQALVRLVAASVGAEDVGGVTIVFDSKDMPRDVPAQQIDHGVTVLYSSGYEDADAMLEELIRRAPQPRRLLVVSSDHRVQQAARRRRARFISAEEWLDEVERVRASRPSAEPSPEKPEQPLNDEELDYWRSIFQSKNES